MALAQDARQRLRIVERNCQRGFTRAARDTCAGRDCVVRAMIAALDLYEHVAPPKGGRLRGGQRRLGRARSRWTRAYRRRAWLVAPARTGQRILACDGDRWLRFVRGFRSLWAWDLQTKGNTGNKGNKL